MTNKRYILNRHPVNENALIHNLTFYSDEFETAGGEVIKAQSYVTFIEPHSDKLNDNDRKLKLKLRMEKMLKNRTGLPGRKGYFRLVNALDLFRETKEAI